MVRRKNRLTTDALREVRNTFSRFLSILVLSGLAVAFLAGLRATAPDMQYTADLYYDRTNLMDGYVLSTLGITEEDLEALAAADGVEQVEGGYNLDAIAVDSVVSVRSLPRTLNLLELKEGRLPEGADECVTEELLLVALGLDIGDRLELVLEEGEDGLSRTSYTIVGTAESPLYAGPDRGSSSLGNGSVSAFVYVPEENFDLEVYTIAYFTGHGLGELDCYGDTYEVRLEELVDSLEGLAEERAALRYQSVMDEAQGELDDARQELDDARQELADARQELDDAYLEVEQELADARQELADARQELDDGWVEYHDGLETLERELADGRQKLADAREELEQAQLDYEEGLADYEAGLKEYEDSLALLDEQQAQLDEGYAQYEAALAPYEGSPYYDMIVAQAAEQKAQLDEAQAQLDEGYARLLEAEQELNDARMQLEEAEQAIADGWTEYYDGQDDLIREERDARQELADALVELEDGEREYADGLVDYEEGKLEAETELADAEAELADAEVELADAEGKLADAQAEVDDIEECEWYVLGRDTNAGYVGYAQDSDRVGNLAKVFPVIFFLVAALACLTTMTRMVEEQRTQIGALKAMGFSRFSISKKYIGYAFSASLIGGLLGLALGCTAIPAVIANAFNIMYHIPDLQFKSQPVMYVTAVLAAVLCTTGAGLWACLSTLMDTPANLMRPKAPKAGKRVLLERVKFLWRRLSFTWKVTMRNLFRYQKRFWMTVIGIGGCTALIVTGFGLHESIFSILDQQFDEISLYDATMGVDEDISAGDWQAVEDYLKGSPVLERYLSCHQETVDVCSDGAAYSATLYAIGDEAAFRQFIDLRHRKDGGEVSLSREGAVITEKLSELLEVQVGDTIVLDGDRRVEVQVTDIAEQYVMHNVYLTAELYAQLFDEPDRDNAVLLAYGDGADAELSDRVSEDLMKMEGVVSYSYIATIRDSFTDSMIAIDYAVIIIILAAAALAFVVLYNLTNINITERTRELATLKVLGFHDGETTAYIYRENVFLTVFGIGLGLVLGRLLHSWMVLTVEVDIVMFGRVAPPYAYVLAAVLTVLFSLLVNIAAHFKLKKVDMVESLKTVE